MLQWNALTMALIGTIFTFLVTIIGAATVFFFEKELKAVTQGVFLGFAAGVMVAASVWSLLIPSIQMAQEQGRTPWAPAAGGFIFGGLFLFSIDYFVMPILQKIKQQHLGSRVTKRTDMLLFAVTLHNIPEGMAVGLAFALAAEEGSSVALASAVALALGIGLQNFPEGAAISLPLKQAGYSNRKAFSFGMFSGAVEPVAGVITVLLAAEIVAFMPFLLAFAAGAMIYVVAQELIPAANADGKGNLGTAGVMVGFLIMMVLDVALS